MILTRRYPRFLVWFVMGFADSQHSRLIILHCCICWSSGVWRTGRVLPLHILFDERLVRSTMTGYSFVFRIISGWIYWGRRIGREIRGEVVIWKYSRVWFSIPPFSAFDHDHVSWSVRGISHLPSQILPPSHTTGRTSAPFRNRTTGGTSLLMRNMRSHDFQKLPSWFVKVHYTEAYQPKSTLSAGRYWLVGEKQPFWSEIWGTHDCIILLRTHIPYRRHEGRRKPAGQDTWLVRVIYCSDNIMF